MRERWEGDELFCLVGMLLAGMEDTVASFFANFGFPVSIELLGAIGDAVMFALIVGLFYGPSPKRLSKRVFWSALLIVSAVLILIEFL